MLKYSKIEGIDRRYSKEIDMEGLNRDVSWKIESAEKHKELALRYTHKDNVESCPICKNTEYDKFVTIYNYDYLQCLNCGHLYLRDLIDDESIEKLYLGAEEKNLQHLVYLNEELFNNRVQQIAYPKVNWISEKTETNGLWIDIGCGTGEILFAAKNFGYSTRGIDSDQKQVEFARRKGINVFCDYINQSNASKYLEGGSIVSLFNVLEHLQDPNILLRNISENINKGTYVIMEVPRHPSISSLNNLIFDDISCRHIYPPDHIHIFTEKSMEHMSNDVGLKLKYVWNFGQDAYDFILTALASKNILKNDFVKYIMKLTPVIQRGIDEAGLSDTMIVICEK